MSASYSPEQRALILARYRGATSQGPFFGTDPARKQALTRDHGTGCRIPLEDDDGAEGAARR